MSYVEPPAVIDSMLDSGSTKTDLSAGQLVLRAAFSVFLLAGATALAIFASEETGFGIVGALLFPLGLVVVVLLNVELLTGNFALVPLSVLHKQSTMRDLFRNFSWVLLGHILGGLLAAFLFAALLSQWWTSTSDITAQGLINLAVAKTLDYQSFDYLGGAGLAFLSGILCNWLVVLGVVMGMTSESTSGKILAIWPPIAAFFCTGSRTQCGESLCYPGWDDVGGTDRGRRLVAVESNPRVARQPRWRFSTGRSAALLRA